MDRPTIFSPQQANVGLFCDVFPPVMDGDVMCSSTRIRELLARGETAHAMRLLEIAG